MTQCAARLTHKDTGLYSHRSTICHHAHHHPLRVPHSESSHFCLLWGVVSVPFYKPCSFQRQGAKTHPGNVQSARRPHASAYSSQNPLTPPPISFASHSQGLAPARAPFDGVTTQHHQRRVRPFLLPPLREGYGTVRAGERSATGTGERKNELNDRMPATGAPTLLTSFYLTDALTLF